mmetsp:Transcript_26385/g.39152  ORF Transcript_26385/g.39152 Transcript_26385/m.39152 type:complete len:871 (+) Transcript_26385:98-2710(+)
MLRRDASTRENVKVVCRVRPEIANEVAAGGTTCVRLNDTNIEVNVDEGTHSFTFDRIFGPDSKQMDVFEYCAVPLINDVLNGYNATIFAYGQTSSGKTFTMEGRDIRDPSAKGIIPRTVEALFAGVTEADESIEFCFKASYIEIYCEKVRDLLDNHSVKTNLMVREDKQKGIYIAGVTEEYVTSEDELLGIMSAGALNRAVAATGMNEGSSRSHSVFSITVTQRDVSNATTKSGKLVLVDLAGSETVRKTQASGQQLEEAKTINKSLSALGQVIYALTDEKTTHVPYRDSKLTRILQDSLGGNSKTALIINCSPSSFNATETVSTLRFGTRAKSITNKVIKNETRSVEELEELLLKAERAIDAQQAQIMALAAQLQAYQNEQGAPPEGNVARMETEAGLIEKLQSTVQSLQAELDEEREESARKDKENEKLSEKLSEKEAVLIEAGGLMQDAQHLYENAKSRCEQLVREKADAFGEIESLKSQLADDRARSNFEIQELEVTVDTYKAENEKLRQEIADMSGDDMRNEREDRLRKESANQRTVEVATPPPVEREATPPPPPVPENASQQPLQAPQLKPYQKSHRSDKRGSVLARELDIEGRHANTTQALNALTDLVNSMDIPRQDGSAILHWAHAYAESTEKWFGIAEEKFSAFERGGMELGRRIKDLEAQRTRLEKDLEIRTEKVMQQQLEMDIIRNESRSTAAAELMEGREQYQNKSLQQRLEQLVAVHRQLLRKFASLELENSELRKKILLRDERIRQLETNAKGLTANLRQQAERHITELTNLREQIQELKVEHQQRMDGRGNDAAPVAHHHQPRVIRGGVKDAGAAPKSLRGGGGKHSQNSADDDSSVSSRPSVTSGLISRLLGAK